MATNWTDLTLFTSGEALTSLPRVFDGLDTDNEKYDFQTEVKRDMERIINDVWSGVGRLTETTSDDFDIEEINNGSILKDTALEYNYVLLAKYYMTNAEDVSDQYGSYYTGLREVVSKKMEMDIKQLKFDEPDGINQLDIYYVEMTR